MVTLSQFTADGCLLEIGKGGRRLWVSDFRSPRSFHPSGYTTTSQESLKNVIWKAKSPPDALPCVRFVRSMSYEGTIMFVAYSVKAFALESDAKRANEATRYVQKNTPQS